MRTRTADVLFLCFLIPLGDGLEGMFMFYMRDVLGFDAGSDSLGEYLHFRYLSGSFGPWLSDLWSCQGSTLVSHGFCGLLSGLSGMMFVGAPEIALLIMWMPTLMITDWLIFTFITTWAEVNDPRLGPTHVHCIRPHSSRSDLVWFGLEYSNHATNGAY